MDPLVEQALAALGKLWPDLPRAAAAWARVTPVVLLVPAFGLRSVVAPVRLALGLAMAVAVSPLLQSEGAVTPWRLVEEAMRGLPIALTAAAALHVATMTGGLLDTLRGDRLAAEVGVVPEGTSPLGTVFGLLVAVVFLEGGGAAELCRLAAAPPAAGLTAAAGALVRGVGVAVAVAMPVVVVSIVAEVGFALTARSASPAHVTTVLAPARSLVVLAAIAVVLDRLLGALAAVAQSGTR